MVHALSRFSWRTGGDLVHLLVALFIFLDPLQRLIYHLQPAPDRALVELIRPAFLFNSFPCRFLFVFLYNTFIFLLLFLANLRFYLEEDLNGE